MAAVAPGHAGMGLVIRLAAAVFLTEVFLRIRRRFMIFFQDSSDPAGPVCKDEYFQEIGAVFQNEVCPSSDDHAWLFGKLADDVTLRIP